MKNLQYLLKANSGKILVGLDILGVMATSALCVRAGMGTKDILEDLDEESTTKDKIAALAPLYIPPVLMGVATIGGILGLGVMNHKQQVGFTSAYGVLHQSFDNYKAKNIELYGSEHDEHIKEEIVRDERDRSYVLFVDNGCIETPKKKDGTELFYDELSRTFFYAKMSDIIDAEKSLNHKLRSRGYASENDYRHSLGLSTTEEGEFFGWNMFSCHAYGYTEISLYCVLIDSIHDGPPYQTIKLEYGPHYDYLDI